MLKSRHGSLLNGQGVHAISLGERFIRFPWGLLFLLILVATFGLVVLYSAVGGGENTAMAVRHVMRFGVSVMIMIGVGVAGDKLYRRYAYVVYFGAFTLLSTVVVMGSVAMGARRWLDLGVVNLQPSELTKVALLLALARYFHDRGATNGLGWRDLWLPTLMIGITLVLIIKQPDLGTAVLIAIVCCGVLFVAGLPWKVVFGGLASLAALLPVAWNWLHDYQKQRIITLFHPEDDPLGAGYHIIQSKIAVGAGGLFGRGFMQGSQSHLDFLPEQHTDFIFSVLAEEWGFTGAMVLLLLYGLIIVRGMLIAVAARDRFGLFLASGVTALFAAQLTINLSMVIGLLPVVGIPLPLVSYGGSSMLTTMIAMGLLANVSIHSKHQG